ncbi:MAG: TRM11 family SAM-dependent methyltransferase [Candidatus Thorarchaeota archaeon]
MTDYAFVLGKNWLLSLAELVVYLQDRGIADKVKDYSRTSVIIEADRKMDDEQLVDIQSALGGCFKAGRVISVYDRDLVEKAFPARGKIDKATRKMLQEVPWVDRVWHRPRGARIRFGISTYPLMNKQTTVDLKKFTLGMDEWVKKKLMDRGAKRANYYAYEGPDKRDPKKPSVALWPKTIARRGLLSPPNAEILALLTERSVYLARTVAVYDSQLQQYRDEARPYISAEITTSPKMCRTLLNLAGARAGDTVLDPFCGTGTLLMEAAMLGMKCIGLDINGEAVEGARSNMKWLGSNLGEWIDFKILRGDAREISSIVDGEVDAIAFEPELGPVYSEPPSMEEAKSTIMNLTGLYREVLQGAESCLRQQGRVGMTVPAINTTDGQLSVDVEAMTEGTSFDVFKLLYGSAFADYVPRGQRLAVVTDRTTLPERKRGQIVQRAVLMLGRV